MNKTVFKLMVVSAVLIACFGLPKAHAVIAGLEGTNFTLVAKTGPIITGEGDAFQNWGYANGAGPMQYPGPTLIVNQGQLITVTLTNQLTVRPTSATPNVSIVFPGQVGVTATGGVPGLLTQEAERTGGAVTYTFTASQPGTYMYHSGTSPELQIEMGLVGAIIVRPSGFDPGNPRAYAHSDSEYDHEYLFLETEMDDVIHRAVERGRWSQVDTTKWFPHLWFINGRNAPDTMAMAGVSWMPTQPYNCMPRMHPGEKLLLRIVAAGRDPHPFHTHGNNATIIARDGRLLGTPGGGADLGVSDFTFPVAPGGTIDAIFEWTGAGLGWDAYGHQADVDNPPLSGIGGPAGPEDVDHNENGIIDPLPPALPEEYAPDHGKPFPVVLPQQQELTVGGMWSGSPFLGTMGALPPGEGGMNPNSGYTYMWHSHNEKEMTNNDIFPGGLMTMLIIEPPGVPIP